MDEVDALITNSIKAASTENSIVLHVAAWVAANTGWVGTCVPGGELRVHVEEDPQDRTADYNSIDCIYIL